MKCLHAGASEGPRERVERETRDLGEHSGMHSREVS